MLGRYLALVAALFGLVILFVPRGESEPRTGDARAEADGEASTLTLATSQATADWNAGGHTLHRTRDGHFYAEATVDGTPMRMMVDTGASVIALTAEDAVAAGLIWDDSKVMPIGTGASGTVYGVRARLSEVEIGGIVRRNVQAVIIPEGLEVSLLGQSWLSQVDTVEIVDDRMVLGTD